jgi:hypothetical protein
VKLGVQLVHLESLEDGKLGTGLHIYVQNHSEQPIFFVNLRPAIPPWEAGIALQEGQPSTGALRNNQSADVLPPNGMLEGHFGVMAVHVETAAMVTFHRQGRHPLVDIHWANWRKPGS